MSGVQFSGAALKAQLADVFGLDNGASDDEMDREALREAEDSANRGPELQRQGLGADVEELDVKTSSAVKDAAKPTKLDALDKLAARAKKTTTKKRRQPTSAFEGVAATELRTWEGGDDDESDDELGESRASAVKSRKRARTDVLSAALEKEQEKISSTAAATAGGIATDKPADEAGTETKKLSKNTIRNRRRREKKKLLQQQQQEGQGQKGKEDVSSKTPVTSGAKTDSSSAAAAFDAGEEVDVGGKSNGDAADLNTRETSKENAWAPPRDPTAPMQPSWPADKTRRKKKRSKQKNLKKDTRPAGTWIKTHNKYKT
ncbi:Hypothetical Protein FCC1311_064282 [Hondaea fermentalgiana]|uniref:Uncharacterized protein n=1 Tax=Hondaea fermentalgiana TaxID=2315210 RepID=A0A2R5GKF2_9STRA|nr:Hypothetical Protein FCC1311_064282 [Hondaea fermentalgiana]|eukprot:GBG30208.1 Hypothetical Protein FCC1311_064282 [Hondaea fermentalgiana]